MERIITHRCSTDIHICVGLCELAFNRIFRLKLLRRKQRNVQLRSAKFSSLHNPIYVRFTIQALLPRKKSVF